MKTLKSYFVIVLSVFAFTAKADFKVTELDVIQILEITKEASLKKDAATIVEFIDSEAEIILDMPPELGGKLELSRDVYHQLLVVGWSAIKDVEVQVLEQSVRVSEAENRAYVNLKVIENTTLIDEQVISSKGDNSIEFEYVGGRLLMTNIYAKAEIIE